MTVGWPQGIYLAVNVASLLFLAFKAGKGESLSNTHKDMIGRTLTWLVLTLPLLWWGGFFG